MYIAVHPSLSRMGHSSCRVGFLLPAMLLWAVLLLTPHGRFVYSGCPLEEYEALLQLSSSLARHNLTSPPTWGRGRDCCLWERVGCSNNTGRVSSLSLSSFWVYTQDANFIPDWQLNLSIFSSFHELSRLNLSSNAIVGSLPCIGLKKLEVLDLRNNMLNGSIPSCFGSLPLLNVLNLGSNSLSGTLSVQVLDRLQSLRVLDLHDNQFNGNIEPQLFANLTLLQYLDLSNNYFKGHFSFLSFANLSKLEAVIVSNNEELAVDLGGRSSVPSFQLNVLMLSGCNLEKRILATPAFLSSQYKLEALDLSDNNLIGGFPNWLFENQSRLEYLNLRNNSLSGIFHLPNGLNPSMQAIDLSKNFIGGSLPAKIGMVFPHLVLMNISSNHLIGDIPSSLGNMSKLELLDLSNNNFSGEIPARLMTDCSELTFLKLSNNNLNGRLVTLNRLIFVYLDGNKLTGTLPSNFSDKHDLIIMDVHDNQLSGEIPGAIVAARHLNTLNLRGNRFQGQIPHQLCNLRWLRLLDLSSNNLYGPIPHCCPSSIRYVNLARNTFTGTIPDVFFNSPNLRALDLSDNQLSGNLPSQVGDYMEMLVLILRGNVFEGPVPNQLCKMQSLHMLDLSHNHLFGSVPSCLGKMQFRLIDPYDISLLEFLGFDFGIVWTVPASLLEYMASSYELHKLEMEFSTKGNTYAYQSKNLAPMNGIDLSANRLTGGIPLELGNLNWIISLNLSYNRLMGLIPETLSNLHRIESLDLSHNQLSGMLPWQLSQLTSLEVFSVAYNNLSGCIPEFKNQFGTFNKNSYEGNDGLHGPPLEKTCTSNSSLKVPQEEETRPGMDVDDVILYAISIASFAMGFWVCIVVLYCSGMGRHVRIQLMDHYADSLCERISLKMNKLDLACRNAIKTSR